MSIEKLTEAVDAIKAHGKTAQEKHVPVNNDFVVGQLIDAVNALHQIELDRLKAETPVKVEASAEAEASTPEA